MERYWELNGKPANFEEGIKSVSYSQNGTAYDVSVVLNDGFVPTSTENYNFGTKTLCPSSSS